MPNVTFTKGSDTFTFSKGREYPVHDPVKVNVVMDYSEARRLYAYNKNVAEQFFNLVYRGLSNTDYDNFENWLLNIAVGPTNTFTFTDEDSTNHTVRLMNTENPLRKDNHGLFSGTITLREEI